MENTNNILKQKMNDEFFIQEIVQTINIKKKTNISKFQQVFIGWRCIMEDMIYDILLDSYNIDLYDITDDSLIDDFYNIIENKIN